MWNLFTSGNNQAYQKEFEQYVRMVVLDNKVNLGQTENFVARSQEDPVQSLPIGLDTKVKTGVVSNPESSWFDNLGNNTHMWWNRLMLAMFVRGKKIKTYRGKY